MCRIAAITAELPVITQRRLIHTLLDHSERDGEQVDGFGAVSSNFMFRSGLPYSAVRKNFLEKLPAQKGIFLAHVRKASNPHSRGYTEHAHPYRFNHFIGVHNGFIYMRSTPDNDLTVTDSYKAMSHLDSLITMSKGGEITSPILENWISTFYQDSVFAFALFDLKRNRLHCVRDDARTLYLTKYMNGFILSTTQEIIEKSFFDPAFNDKPRKIKVLEAMCHYTFDYNSDRFTKVKLTAPRLPGPKGSYYFEELRA